jgi:hypothetical protein
MFKSLTMMKTPTTMSGANALALSSMTPAERARGRFMRAPDHDAGTGGGGDAAPAADADASIANAGDGGTDAGAGGGDAGGASGGEQVTGSDADAGKAGEGGEGGDKSGDGADKGAGDEDGSIAGQAGADKAAKAAAELIGAPEAYDVKAPEGMTFDKDVFDAVAGDLKDMDLSNAAAQKLVDLYGSKVVPLLTQREAERAEAAQLERAATIRKEWATEARADPEIGGANFDQTVDACAQVWDRFGIKKGEGIRQLLDESGLGNHPDMLRFLSRVSKGTGEGQFVPSDGAGTDNRPIWDRIYGQPEPAKAG